MAKKVIDKHKPKEEISLSSLEDYGVSIINLNGIYFRHFMQLFQGYKLDGNGQLIEGINFIPIKCAGLTDCDPDKTAKPISTQTCECKNHQLYLQKEFEDNSDTCRLFTNLKTFEYDLALEGGNLKLMLELFDNWLDTNGQKKKQVGQWLTKDWSKATEQDKADAAYELLNHIETAQNKNGRKMGKGLFAQKLAYQLDKDNTVEFEVPTYIEDAILWITKLKKDANS